MADALLRVVDVEHPQAKGRRSAPGAGDELLAAGHQRPVRAAGAGVEDVVHHAEHLLGPTHAAAGLRQRVQGDAAGALVQAQPVDVEKVFAVVVGFDSVAVPQLVEQRARH